MLVCVGLTLAVMSDTALGSGRELGMLLHSCHMKLQSQDPLDHLIHAPGQTGCRFHTHPKYVCSNMFLSCRNCMLSCQIH